MNVSFSCVVFILKQRWNSTSGFYFKLLEYVSCLQGCTGRSMHKNVNKELEHLESLNWHAAFRKSTLYGKESLLLTKAF